MFNKCVPSKVKPLHYKSLTLINISIFTVLSSLFNIIMSHEAKMISIPFKALQNLKFISVTIWPGCTELTLFNQMWSLISQRGLSSVCQTSWWQLPCPSPMGNCLTPTNGDLPPCLGPPLFMALKKQGSGWWHYPSDVCQGIQCLHTVFHAKGLS